MTLSLRRQPDLTGALAAQQREEDARAAAWVEGEIGRWLARVEPSPSPRNASGHSSLCAIYAGPAVQGPCNCGAL